MRGERERLLATTGKARSTLFPDTPTVAETGVGQFSVDTWREIVASAGTQANIVATLAQAIDEAGASEALRKRFADGGAEAFRGSPAGFAAVLADELRNWRKVEHDSGMRLDQRDLQKANLQRLCFRMAKPALLEMPLRQVNSPPRG